MNNCTFAGRLGRDPELRQTPDGQTVAKFPLAVNRRRRDADPLWLDVSVWGRQAELVARYLSKGRECVVSGEVDVRTFQRRDGSQGFAVTLNAKNITFVGSRGNVEPAVAGTVPVATASNGGQMAVETSVPPDVDIPF